MRVLHINLAKRGIGRYGVLYGQALGNHPGVTARSIFDADLFEDAPVLQEQLKRFDHVLLPWERQPKHTSLLRLAQVVRAFKPDLIHDSSGSYNRSLLLWPLLSRFGRLVVTEHDPVVHVGMQASRGERAARWLLGHLAEHVFVHGASCQQMLVDRGLPATMISRIRHGHLGPIFDRGAYQAVVRRPQEVLFFGELRPNKGFDMLPEIAASVHQRFPDARFVVAGSSKGIADRNAAWGERIREVLEEMQRQPYFEVHDRFIPDEEVEFFFKRAGLALMPYREATQSGVAMVAMPLGSVVIATAVGDIPEVVQDGVTGYLVEPFGERVAERLVHALQHPEEVSRIRDQALAFARTDCSWETVVATVIRTVGEKPT